MLVVLFSLSCSNERNKQTIQFEPLSENEFNFPADTTFAIPHSKIWDDRMHVHDSCMGSSYAANAIFMRTRDTFLIGSIVDMRTMKVVSHLPLFTDSTNFFSSIYTFETTPCYQKTLVNIPIDSFMNWKDLFELDTANNNINHELIEAIKNSDKTEIETGSWITMEMTDALGKILDTTTNPTLLEYKKALLTPGNMILVRSSAISDITFYFHTEKPLPDDLTTKLLNRPVSIQQAFFKSQLFYIDKRTFKLTLTGFFQMLGQFMKCEPG